MYMIAVMWMYPYEWVLAYMFVVKELECAVTNIFTSMILNDIFGIPIQIHRKK
jgi:hypothetical protein